MKTRYSVLKARFPLPQRQLLVQRRRWNWANKSPRKKPNWPNNQRGGNASAASAALAQRTGIAVPERPRKIAAGFCEVPGGILEGKQIEKENL